MWPNPEETADLVTVTEEILNGKFHFLCSEVITTYYISGTQPWTFQRRWGFLQSDSRDNTKNLIFFIFIMVPLKNHIYIYFFFGKQIGYEEFKKYIHSDTNVNIMIWKSNYFGGCERFLHRTKNEVFHQGFLQ